MVNSIEFLDNNFLILRESENINSPVACLHYEFYNDKNSLVEKLKTNAEKLQCIVSRAEFIGNSIDFGKSQHPMLNDYADNMDTMDFLLNL